MGWHTILFDLDGTLTDPRVGITTAASTALAPFGVHEPPEKLTWLIGPPLYEAFQDRFGLSPAQSDEAVRLFRDYYDHRGWQENEPYPGVADMLSALRAAGKRLLVATTKPEEMAVRILHHFGLAEHLSVICGAPPAPPEAAHKDRIIRNALRRAGITDLSGAVMVGDRRHDVEGARRVGLTAVGVLYGYGSRAELEQAGARRITETVQSLTALLME
ncbi:MAG: HAD family hydrolase [Ruminococcaceae bacterium]|nr:HAD family hydrolase [Oscillospiraceae bacterium]